MIPLSLHCAEKIENIGNIGGKILLQQKKIIFFLHFTFAHIKRIPSLSNFKKRYISPIKWRQNLKYLVCWYNGNVFNQGILF